MTAAETCRERGWGPGDVLRVMAITYTKKQRDFSRQTGKVLVAFGYDGRSSSESQLGACDMSMAVSEAEAKEMFSAIMDIRKKYKKPRRDPIAVPTDEVSE